MKKQLLLFFAIIIIFFLSVQTSTSVPKKNSDPVFSDITVTSSTKQLLLFAMLNNSFTDEMLQGLHSGLPIHFSFFIEMSPTEKKNGDDLSIAMKTSHVISYDTLKETYRVEIEESGKRFYSFQSLEEAQKAANELNGLKVVELTKLRPGTSYTIRLRAELYKKTLPMGLHDVVPFVSWWDVKTKWHTISFKL